MHLIQSLDTAILLNVQDHVRCGFLNAVMIFFSSIGSWGLVWIVTAVVLLAVKKHRYTGIVLLLCLAVSWVVCDCILKNLVQRPRPYITISSLHVLIQKLNDFSFPSGHTTTSFASAYALTRLRGRRWTWTYAVAAMITLSRIYIGMHYPSDVLCGIALGTLVAALVCALSKRFLKRDILGSVSDDVQDLHCRG